MRLLLMALASTFLLAQPKPPDLTSQKTAMRKLEFLAGNWSGDATVSRGPNQTLKLVQTEHIEYRLDGLILVIEGTGRDPQSGRILFNAFAVVSYDESKGSYAIRAYSSGRIIDTPFESDGAGFAWGFPSGPANVRHVMRLTEKGEWAETTKVKVGEAPEFTSVQMLLQKQPAAK